MRKKGERKDWQEKMIPERLTEAEVEEIVRKIDDPRLSGKEDLEHFTVKLKNKTVFVAKHRFIPFQRNGEIENIKVEEVLRQLLNQQG